MLGIRDDGHSRCPSSTQGMDIFPLYRIDGQRLKSAGAIAADLAIRNARWAKQFGWSYSDSHRERFAGRGLCAGHAQAKGATADDLRVPRWTGSRWLPFRPTEFRSCAARTRWVRTPNDAFMIGHLDFMSDLKLKARRNRTLSVHQLMESSTYSGAFHPTAEG
ncbi:MAG: hypothetical protein AAF709_07955 [Pseudomonadota bacterium]